jgi:tRNA threonylcarbamoyladenosine biosynthesis protein TsaB
MIDEMLKRQSITPSSLSAVSVSIGPGSYTGLRVGLSTGKSICYVTGCPLIAVDTLHSLAFAAGDQLSNLPALYVAVLDARRQDAYAGVFDQEGNRLEEDRFLTVTPECLAGLGGRSEVVICGEGLGKWESFKGKTGFRLLPIECSARYLVPIAARVLHQGNTVDLATIVPNYIKPPNITVKA